VNEALSSFYSVVLYQSLGEVRRAERFGQLLREQATAAGSTTLRAPGLAVEGWAIGLQGRYEEALDLLRRAVVDFERVSLTWLGYVWYLMGDVLASTPDRRGAHAAIDRAMELVDRTGIGWIAPEVLRLRGRMLADDARDAQAEECLRDALGRATAQGAQLWGARAAMDLGVLLARTGREGEARDTLAGVCNDLPEGFPARERGRIDALLSTVGPSAR